MNTQMLKAIINKYFKDTDRRERLLILLSFLELGSDGELINPNSISNYFMLPFVVRNFQTESMLEFVTNNIDMFAQVVHQFHENNLPFHEALTVFSKFTIALVQTIYREEKQIDLSEDVFDPIFWSDVLAPFWYAFNPNAYYYEKN